MESSGVSHSLTLDGDWRCVGGRRLRRFCRQERFSCDGGSPLRSFVRVFFEIRQSVANLALFIIPTRDAVCKEINEKARIKAKKSAALRLATKARRLTRRRQKIQRRCVARTSANVTPNFSRVRASARKSRPRRAPPIEISASAIGVAIPSSAPKELSKPKPFGTSS